MTRNTEESTDCSAALYAFLKESTWPFKSCHLVTCDTLCKVQSKPNFPSNSGASADLGLDFLSPEESDHRTPPWQVRC